ncbi:MAG: hypothetical protein GY811_12225 [Myxococcales bacterium]|nr:hypothetical protein [Myxococcales bacterium]
MLIRWANLEERRRRLHNGGMQALPGAVLSVFLGGLLAVEVARRILMASEADFARAVISASHLWLAVAICGYLVGVFGASFRLFWRRDSKILASLPVPGRSLFALALWRSQRVALHVSIALACGLIAFGVLVDWEVAARHLVPILLGFAGAAWLGPAASLAAGAIVASDKAQSMIAKMGGEFQAPRTTWLSLLPGLAATVVAVALISCAAWTLGGRPPGGSIVVVIAVGIGVPLASLAWAWARADLVVPAAVREVAALDQEILAHIERSTPSAIERGFFKVWLRDTGVVRVALKDAALSRRRYPSPYFLISCGIVGLWIVAGTVPEAYLAWGGAVLAALMVYAIVMARRYLSEPVEIPALLRSLPVSQQAAVGAKGAGALLRICTIALLGGVPVLLRAPDLVGTGIFVGAITALALLASLALCRRL